MVSDQGLVGFGGGGDVWGDKRSLLLSYLAHASQAEDNYRKWCVGALGMQRCAPHVTHVMVCDMKHA